MKPQQLIILIALLLLLGCRTIKDRTNTFSHIQHQQVQSTAFESFYTDSIGRHWHFQTDSIFYFHPQQGLVGQGGGLSVWESQLYQSRVEMQRDSVGHHESLSNYSRKFFNRPPVWDWLWIGVLLLIAIGGGIRWIRKIIRR